MGAKCALNRHPIYFFRTSPSLGTAQHDHRPGSAGLISICRRDPCSSAFLYVSYFRIAAIKRACEKLVHDFGIVPLNKIGSVAQPLIESAEFLVAGASIDRRPGDFVAIEMQNRQHGSVSRRIQESDPLPAPLERTSLRLAIADYARHYQVGIVEGGSKGVDQRISEFAALVHGVRCMRPAMAGNAYGSRKGTKQQPHTMDVLRDLRMHFGIGSFKVSASVERWP